jgi:hypothetical protein
LCFKNSASISGEGLKSLPSGLREVWEMGSFFNCILRESAVAKSDADEALNERECGLIVKGTYR